MNRRILEGIIVAVLLLKPIEGSVKLWSIKTMQNTTPGTGLHVFAEVVSILT